MTSTSRALPVRGTLLLLALQAALLLLRLGTVPLVGPDEPRYTRVAVEMHRRGDLVRPTLQGQPWLEKPALFYWLAGATFSVLGETEAAARLPSVAAALLLTLATALVGTRLFGASAGLHAGFVLATAPLVFAYGRAASMDMLLAATTTAGLGLYGLRLLGSAGALAVPAGSALLGLAVLAKGPLGLLLPGLVLLSYLALTRDLRPLRQLLGARSLLAFALVATPWYAAIVRDQGWHFVEVFLLNHNVQRFTSTIHNHPGPFWFYLPVLIAGLLPWSGLILTGISTCLRERSRADLFLLCWLVAPLAFFSAAGSKLPGYILPCLPPLALLMGRGAAALVSELGRLRGWAGARSVALVALAGGATFCAAPLLLRRDGGGDWPLAVPAGAWALLGTFAASRAFSTSAEAGLRLLRTTAAGFLVLLTSAAPTLLARRESGRDLFAPAGGREVLALGAWRTAWMAGYFYNDGHVREIEGPAELFAATERGPVLVLCGVTARRELLASSAYSATVLSGGPRGHVLLELRRR